MGRYDLGRALVEGIITRALKDMENDSRRTARNLVDLGLTLAKGPFERLFLETCRKILDNEDSTYYYTLDRAIRDFDRQTLITYSINTGFEGCSRGAKRIREIEQSRGFNIPWSIRLSVGRQGLDLACVRQAIEEAMTLGVYVFRLVDCQLEQDDLAELLESHPTCAFTIFTTGCRTPQWDLESLTKYHNLLFSVCTQAPMAGELCSRLTRARMPYAVHMDYDDQSASTIFGQLEQAQSLGSLLVLLQGYDASPAVRERIYSQVVEARSTNAYPFVPIDIPSDLLAIDQVISSDACSLEFLPDGRAVTHKGITDSSIKTMSLERIMEKELVKGRG